jgi:glycerophosphoryl diester phosphodiesterase
MRIYSRQVREGILKPIEDGPIFYRRNSYRTPLIMAHRGGNTLAPQNSLPAFERSCRTGVWALETDIRLTKDGVPVCHHDASVDAMTDGEGLISEMTFDELKKCRIDCGVGADTLPADELRIPTMAEYFDICMRYGTVPFIEIKTDGTCEMIIRELRRRSMESFAVISAIDIRHIREARRLSKAVFVHHIFSSAEHIPELADLGYSGMSFKVKDPGMCPAGLIGDVHEAGVRVCLRAADTPQIMRKMIDMGLDYQPSNFVFGLD